MNRLRVLILFFSGFSCSLTLLAQPNGTLVGQDSTNRIITTAVPFLTITPDSRAAAMGDAGVATSADANSAYWNSAKLVRIDNGFGGSASYTPWLGKIINDMYIFYLSGFYKINREQAVAVSMKYFDLGEIQFNKGPNPNDLLGRYNPREYAFDVTYSRLLTENLSIGGAIRYIHSNLTGSGIQGQADSRPGNSLAVDLGAFYTKQLLSNSSVLSLGANVSNLGSKISYSDAESKDFIPANLRIGGSFQTDLDPYNGLTFALDFNKLMVPSPYPGSKGQPFLSGTFASFTDARGGFTEEIHEVTASMGMEYWYNHVFAGRVGYFLESKDKGNRKYLTAGLGLRFNVFGFDMAYVVPTNKRELATAEQIRITLMLALAKRASEDDSVTD
ncbi:MAG TPA: type IX secretion system outer membrane channel protein PorV [Cyclobacteriaceae bacterium]|nr:type IX secretion system outer membrane channel protein PorV [Cyclobacteriaceae bacterium]